MPRDSASNCKVPCPDSSNDGFVHSSFQGGVCPRRRRSGAHWAAVRRISRRTLTEPRLHPALPSVRPFLDYYCLVLVTELFSVAIVALGGTPDWLSSRIYDPEKEKYDAAISQRKYGMR